MADKLNVSSVVRETLVTEVFVPPTLIHVFSAVRESLVGDAYGYALRAAAYAVVRESLIRELPVSFASVVRESLVSRLQEDATQAYLTNGFTQSAVMRRPPMADPATVRSNINVNTYRQNVIVARTVTAAYSGMSLSMLRQHVTMRRLQLPPSAEHSATNALTLRMQVVQSRGRAYEPISMVYSAQLRSQVIAHRVTTPAGEIRTPIRIGSHAQQVVQSRVHAQVVIQTYAYLPALQQQVVQQDTRPAPISATTVATLRAMVVRAHAMPAPGIDDRVAQIRQQAVQQRQITPPQGADKVAGMVQQVAVSRDSGPPLSATIARSLNTLTLMRKDAIPPAYALGRHTASLAQQVAISRVTPGVQRSVTQVASVRLNFVLARDTPAPIEVIDPSVGRHVFGLRMLTVQHRASEPPETISKLSRFVRGVVGQVVIGDLFEPPPYPEPVRETQVGAVIEQAVYRDRDEWVPVSALTVMCAESAVVVLDAEDWVDPTMPQSAVSVSGAWQQLAIGGEPYPDPFLPHSDIDTVVLASQVAVGDPGMPDPMLPLSDVSARALIESAVTGDAEWADPTIPLSDVSVRRVAAILAVRDPLLTGFVGGSDARALTVAQIYVTRDPTMKGVALRSGPRPVVSVTIS